ncbi:uncharacterized protein LOC128158398 [Crassostrea angulata]|uniref:DUF1772 domain-containing protein n=1 Tax=Magallana gigas TaxID=29159 RepID=K1RNJ8_MAGGI|nr:uncharacterized protein LOC105331949 isoform X1 [Crassostrea gigas]XP_052677160.1 uncharacterized protein LOC128158398 [Crassostrea angulata]|eukprot:XP_011432643.1 PREDICTED: uncharacterized protein LOC105331949 [Crassostrea gigas]
MDRQRWLDLAGFAAVGCSAYFSGAAWYINLVHVPTLFETVHDTKTLLEEWRLCYSLSRKYQGKLAMVGATSAAAVWYLSEVGEQRWLWLAGGLTFISVWPWTLLAMMPDISKLHEEDVLKKEGESWVRDKIKLWNRRHAVRSVVSSLAFDLLAAAVYLNRMT